MSRRIVGVCVFAVASLSLAGVAFAGGGLTFKSKSGTVPGGSQKDLNLDCGKTNAVSAGFDGMLEGSLMNIKATYFTKLQIDEDDVRATALAVNQPVKVKLSALCGSLQLRRVGKRIKTTNDGGLKTATAKCSGNRTAISGGFKTTVDLTPGGSGGAIPVGSYRSGAGSWSVVFASPSGSEMSGTAYAYCAKHSVLKARSKKVTLDPTPSDDVSATNISADCKRGERVLSGGFRPVGVTVAANSPVTIDSYRKSSDAWHIASAVSAQSAKVVAYAYCEKK